MLFLLSDLSVGLLERFAPRISSFALSPVVKNLIFVVFLGLYASFLVSYLGDELARTREGADLLGGLLSPSGAAAP